MYSITKEASTKIIWRYSFLGVVATFVVHEILHFISLAILIFFLEPVFGSDNLDALFVFLWISGPIALLIIVFSVILISKKIVRRAAMKGHIISWGQIFWRTTFAYVIIFLGLRLVL